MADDDTPAGFFSRWSRRKADVQQGRTVAEPAVKPPNASAVAREHTGSVARHDNSPLTPNALANKAHVQTTQPSSQTDTQPVPVQAPTLEDVQQLTPESNFAPFMSRQVAPAVKNAAMKKLFSDPHFNVMDGLDIYIDDYNVADPLPPGMLEKMTSIDGLNLFEKPADAEVSAHAVQGNVPSAVALTESSDNPPQHQPDTLAHDHADLRLQSNPTARPEGVEPKPE